MSPDRHAATPGIYLLPLPWIVDVDALSTAHTSAHGLSADAAIPSSAARWSATGSRSPRSKAVIKLLG